MEVSLEHLHEDISSSFSPHTLKAQASFLKDKAVSLLSGATFHTYFGPVDTSTQQQQQQQEEDLDDDIVRDGPVP